MLGDWILCESKYYRYKYPTANYNNELDGGLWMTDSKGDDFYTSFQDIEPVPLKRIHLTKNGFKATDEDDREFVYRDGYAITVNFEGGILDAEPIISLSIDFAEKDLWMEIEYVHQLQQPMRIFGIDKDIKL